MNYIKFNRHDLFTSEMLETTIKCINGSKDFNLTNKLYGLFDGYLYNDLMEIAIESKVDKEIENMIAGLINAIEMYIKITDKKFVQ